jgi:hypothetical protein
MQAAGNAGFQQIVPDAARAVCDLPNFFGPLLT